MSGRGQLRVAAVQATPADLDRKATLDIVADHVTQAGADGADLVVFPESFVPGYPDWLRRQRPWSDADWYARFQDQSIELPGPDLDDVCAAGASAGAWVALAITERTQTGTLYNAVVYIDDTGAIAGLHRKLVPAGAERLVWANGQGPVLTVVDIGGVRVGSLICWENYMPLARAALYDKGIDVLLAPTWDNSDEWVTTLRHIAKEGQVFVVGITAHLRGSDVPRDLPGAGEIYGGDDDWMSRGTPPSSLPAARSSTGRSSVPLGHGPTATTSGHFRPASAARHTQRRPHRSTRPIGHERLGTAPENQRSPAAGQLSGPPQPPPPGVSIRRTSPACNRIVHLSGRRLAKRS